MQQDCDIEGAVAAVLGWLRQALPPGFAVAGRPIADAEPAAFPDEEEAIRNAMTSRRREFRSGRDVARQALRQLGHHPASIPRGRNGEPIWPITIAGSISHTRRAAIAVAASTQICRSIGIDIEEVADIDPDITPIICRPGELSRAHLMPLAEAAYAKLIFVAKETVFKALFPLFRVHLEFQDVNIVVDPMRASFAADVPSPIIDSNCLKNAAGRFLISEAFLAASYWIDTGRPSSGSPSHERLRDNMD